MKKQLLHFLFFFFIFSKLNTSAQVAVPYYNSFDLVGDTAGWSHYALYGVDDWQLGTPSKTYFNSANTIPNAWVTKLSGYYTASSIRCLQTPAFDLSDTTENYYFSINHKLYSYTTVGFYIEYSLNGGATWLMLSGASIPQKNWQGVSSGFTTYSYISFQNSNFSLKHLQGNPSVTFRFRFQSNLPTDFGEGWMIDDFAIKKEDFNVTANRGTDITELNKWFTQFTVTSTLGLNNPYVSPINLKNSFYFSYDSIFDAGDTLLYSSNANYFISIPSWSKTLNLPANLFAKKYYVFYRLDELDTLAESSEIDNVSYVTLTLDSIFTTNYSDHFDHANEYWNASSAASSPSIWNKGDPNLWQMEDPHSGENCWYPLETAGATNYLESPYLDLSTTSNNTICFWYRDASTGFSASTFSYLNLPALTPALTAPPAFSSSSQLPYPRNRWDCYCKSISAYDGNISTKFRITGPANQDLSFLSGIIVDDIYIGRAKSDLSIEGEKRNRFTTDARATDTLFYTLYNSGLQASPVSQTDFYWSSDSLLDAGDILLGSKSEAPLTDTAFSKQSFVYTKPTLASGKYYLLYVLDPGLLIDEMREYNDTGYFELYQQSFTNLPYSNDFETQIDNWRHYASLGSDDWKWSVPFKPNIPSAFSGTKAFVTNDSSGVSAHSRMHLVSPVFDLSQLADPVITFNMKNFPFNMIVNTDGAANMYYSTDGGYKWQVLKPTNRSFARWYHRYDYDNIAGRDIITYPYQANLFEGKQEYIFDDYLTYQTRDADEITSFCMDMGFLAGQKQVQFKLNYASEAGLPDGVMIDDFTISEGAVDLVITNTRNLYCDSTDQFLRINLSIKNIGNKQVDQINYNIYLSIDTILDAGDFLFYAGVNLDSLKPSFRRAYNIKDTTPSNYGMYDHVIFELDPTNIVAESNELNNVITWPLNINSNPPLIYFNDFNADEIHGWNYYIDSTGFYYGHRFRHKLISGDLVYGPGTEWFMDAMVSTPSSLAGMTRQYLESPSFDFSSSSNIKMEFDFMCIGEYAGFNTQGGNAQYSDDGGSTWTTLTLVQDPYAVNWYNGPSITTIYSEPGWGYTYATTLHAKYDLSFLQGKGNVRIRFQYKSNKQITTPGEQGFRLDNFEIRANALDLVANDAWVPVTADIAIPYFTINYSITNTGSLPSTPTLTNFFWSADNVLDSNDVQLYSFAESGISGMATNFHVKNIYYPVPVTQYVYYLFYKIDSADIINEVSEINNSGSYVVTFNGLSGINEVINGIDATVVINDGVLHAYGKLEKNEQDGIAEIVDLNGKLLRTLLFNVNRNAYEFEIPLSNISFGLYMLNLKFKSNGSSHIKFTVTK